ncbi:MAG: alpha-2-macroglobulin, partial [Acidobacteriota bacterium]
MRTLKGGLLFVAGLMFLSGNPAGVATRQAPAADYQQIKARAESEVANGSFRRTHELYVQAAELDLDAGQQRWVDFRLADTSWRAQAGTTVSDSSVYELARRQLEVLIRDNDGEALHDPTWAEAQESLADFWWGRRDSHDWGQAWSHYQQALDWWAASSDIELARSRYLQIVWKMAEPPGRDPYFYYGYYGGVVPLEILDNVLDIATADEDRARAHFLVAMTLRQQGGDWNAMKRIPEEFEAALEADESGDWYDDALYHYAQWLASNGRVVREAGGQWRTEPDYEKALELFRRIVSIYLKGETRYYDDAVQQIDNITRPAVGVSASNFFLPDSEVEFHLSWRNVPSVTLNLYGIDLNGSVDFTRFSELSGSQWLESIDLDKAGSALVSWSVETADAGDYQPGQKTIRLPRKLALGAYLLEAGARSEATEVSARELVLVTDASLVLKTAGQQALVYFCNSFDGSPIAGASVAAWERSYIAGRWSWRRITARTGEDGIALLRLAGTEGGHDLYVAAGLRDHQAFSTGSNYSQRRADDSWRIYAVTDRPVYRPGERVRWKLVARTHDGSVYSTPAASTIELEIADPHGAKVDERKLALNAFGSVWGELELTEAMPLGEYRVSFWDRGRRHHIGDATLFRLEEYKLPEFRISVRTAEIDGQKKAFRLGDKVEVEIQADYYFGGPVANASVEVVVYQNPFYHWWARQRRFDWYYRDMSARPWQYGGGQGQIVRRELLRTGPDGTAKLSFDTPATAGQDFEYRIEARVRDASRREVIGSDTVRVTRQPYYVYSRPRHNLYQPQDRVEVEFNAVDANQQPVQIDGTVKVSLDSWQEIWLDPQGKEVAGRQLQVLRQQSGVFPPRGGGLWQLKFRGYRHEEILTRAARTDTAGEATISFTPHLEGYYRVSWASAEDQGESIVAQTMVWVATGSTTELGYRHGGLGIIVDADTFQAGQKAAVMLTSSTPDRYVLFSIEGEGLYDYRLVHLTGTVKLLQIEIEETHIPNIFLSGVMVDDQQIYMDTEQVVVPPTGKFLDVEVVADRQQYGPGEEGTLTVSVHDSEGRPVVAEVSLGLVDESTFYIQGDYAADPRQFFYGQKRSHTIRTVSSFQQKRYAQLVEADGGVLVDRHELMPGQQQPGARDANRRLDDDRPLMNRSFSLAAKSSSEVGALAGRMRGFADAAGQLAAEEMVPAAEPSGQGPAVQVRSDFRATAFWQPAIVTGADGHATVELTYPDSLTSWQAAARVATADSEFGAATTTTRTSKPLLVRLQAPRFFVVGDTATISAIINNNTGASMSVRPTLRVEGAAVVKEPGGVGLTSDAGGPRVVGANAEERVDWLVSVKRAGPVKLTVAARGDRHADAMERSLIAHEHGVERLVARSGKLRGDEITLTLPIPGQRQKGSTRFSVQITPSMAVTMLDALPYLIDYPYGCTEQTMSRFLPAVITAKTLVELGLEPGQIEGRIFGGIVPQHAASTHPRGRRDLRQLDEMVRRGLDRLYDFQHADGGWGWWKEGDSDHFMSAYVVWGMSLARDAGVVVKENVLARGARFLELEIVEEESHADLQAWMLHALASYSASMQRQGRALSWQVPPTRAFDNLWARRHKLNAYTRALLALSAQQLGLADQARTLAENLENGVKIDDRPDASIIQRPGRSSEAVIGTAHWGEDGLYWRWSEGGVEATSMALRALLMIDPQSELIEPVVNWLIKNRRGAQWSNTRDTAITVLALNDYLRASGELQADLEYELRVNGHTVASRHFTSADLLAAPSQLVIDNELLVDGDNQVRILRKAGDGPIYFAAQATFFSLEEPVPATGNEIFVRRRYYKIVAHKTLLNGYVYDKRPLREGEKLRSGQRLEVVVTIEAKNNYEYLLFEDLKPAGLEAVEVRSGGPLFARQLKSRALSPEATADEEAKADDLTGRRRWVYRELRDRKVALFIDKLPEGFWQIRYQLRAEVPGEFHALPLTGQAMYVPEIRANSKELSVSVIDGDENA